MRISDWSSDVCSSDLLGFLGVPRRYFEMGETSFIPESAATLNAFVTVVALLVGFTQLVFLFNLVRSAFKARLAERNPWQATTLERSDERRVGTESVSTCRSRWSPYH